MQPHFQPEQEATGGVCFWKPGYFYFIHVGTCNFPGYKLYAFEILHLSSALPTLQKLKEEKSIMTG